MAQVILDLDPKVARRVYVMQNVVWVWLGLVGIVSCVQFFVDPSAIKMTAIGHKLSNGLDVGWSVGYGVGGTFIALGIMLIRTRTEVVGHIFFAGAVLVNAIAVLDVAGPGLAFWTILGIAAASLARMFYLLRWARGARGGA